jgi:LAS superfamily LD-carboxypeptidase LdcB
VSRTITVPWRGQTVTVELVGVDPGYELAVDAAHAWRQMKAAAEKDGVILRPRTAFRSREYQQRLREKYERYRDYVEARAEWEKLGKVGDPPAPIPYAALAARPGSSAHEVGRAVDVDGAAVVGSPVETWIAANCQWHGWKRTVSSEPWHVEFVG